MFRHLKLHHKSPQSFQCLRSFSSSKQDSSTPDDSSPPSNLNNANGSSSSSSSPSSSYSSFFSEIKDRLKSPPSPPRRIPTNPPPPAFSPSSKSPPASLEEIRKHLAEFRIKSAESPSVNPSFSFQDLLKKDVHDTGKGIPFDSIRESLNKFRDSSRETLKGPQLIGTDKLPDSIFGKERREKKEGEEGEMKGSRTEFVKMYGYEELGEKLKGLRPGIDEKKGEWFSLTELNERLAKLRELEEKETESKMGGVSFRDLRESLQRLKDSNAVKKANSEYFF